MSTLLVCSSLTAWDIVTLSTGTGGYTLAALSLAQMSTPDGDITSSDERNSLYERVSDERGTAIDSSPDCSLIRIGMTFVEREDGYLVRVWPEIGKHRVVAYERQADSAFSHDTSVRIESVIAIPLLCFLHYNH
ncbi:hypothetical protein EDB83DRAFT_1181237 [Lactarius deliciosus]|nr:hypothetical protein EDB83DRAFT_1181237 [Lactarius deliciosus]